MIKLFKNLWILLVLVPSFVFSAPGVNTVVLTDETNVDSAVNKLKAILENQGFTIPLTVNHSAAAASVDLVLDPNQVIYARPPRQLERKLLRKSQTIGLDLPMKFHVYEDNGQIILAVNSIGYLIDRHQMKIGDLVLELTNRISQQFGTTVDTGLITVASSRSVEETVETLENAISANPDVRIPLVLDYRVAKQDKAGSRKRDKAYLSPILIVFGNPNVGTFLMQSDSRIGIDLPLEFLVWKNREDEVFISYTDPQFMSERFDLVGQDARINAISNALQGLASQGTD